MYLLPDALRMVEIFLNIEDCTARKPSSFLRTWWNALPLTAIARRRRANSQSTPRQQFGSPSTPSTSESLRDSTTKRGPGARVVLYAVTSFSLTSYDLQTGRQEQSFENPDFLTLSASFHALATVGPTIFLGCSDGMIRGISTRTFLIVVGLGPLAPEGGRPLPTSVINCTNNTICVGWSNGAVSLYDLTSKRILRHASLSESLYLDVPVMRTEQMKDLRTPIRRCDSCPVVSLSVSSSPLLNLFVAFKTCRLLTGDTVDGQAGLLNLSAPSLLLSIAERAQPVAHMDPSTDNSDVVTCHLSPGSQFITLVTLKHLLVYRLPSLVQSAPSEERIRISQLPVIGSPDALLSKQSWTNLIGLEEKDTGVLVDADWDMQNHGYLFLAFQLGWVAVVKLPLHSWSLNPQNSPVYITGSSGSIQAMEATTSPKTAHLTNQYSVKYIPEDEAQTQPCLHDMIEPFSSSSNTAVPTLVRLYRVSLASR